MRSTITQRRAARRVLIPALLLLFSLVSAAQDRRIAPQASADPFARRAWTLDLGVHGAIETWNYNDNHEDMLAAYTGVTYGLGRGVQLKWGPILYRVWQRGADTYLLGATGGMRGRFCRRPRWSLFWEFDLGVSRSEIFVPPRGTRFNYLAISGGGATLRIRPGIDGFAGLRWIHLSNNRLAGGSRNPDIEAIGPTLGVLIGF